MATSYTQNGHETNGDKPVDNGVKMKDFGVFWLKTIILSCLMQTGIINNSYARSTPEKRGVVSLTKTFCAKRMRFGWNGNGIATPRLHQDSQ
jgi:hypothetical protein